MARGTIGTGTQSRLSFGLNIGAPAAKENLFECKAYTIVFRSDFLHEIAMEDALHEINEILERKDITDKQKAMILGENGKKFYNL